ncbi:hypothetical protein ABB02_00898 [Clostridiaceae bacterium JG1575]|nr:hypothetical protein ABB02_00898 [Clostridiaceae bacterium JG1575]
MNIEQAMDERRWMVLGNVTAPDKVAHQIFRALQDHGYEVVGFHPKAISGEGVYNDWTKLPFNPVVLDLVVRPEVGLEFLADAVKAGVRFVVAQPGARSEAIRSFCEEHHVGYFESCALVALRERGRGPLTENPLE